MKKDFISGIVKFGRQHHLPKFLIIALVCFALVGYYIKRIFYDTIREKFSFTRVVLSVCAIAIVIIVFIEINSAVIANHNKHEQDEEKANPIVEEIETRPIVNQIIPLAKPE